MLQFFFTFLCSIAHKGLVFCDCSPSYTWSTEINTWSTEIIGYELSCFA